MFGPQTLFAVFSLPVNLWGATFLTHTVFHVTRVFVELLTGKCAVLSVDVT